MTALVVDALTVVFGRFTALDRVNLDDERFSPVWEELSRRRATVFCHPTVACCTDGHVTVGGPHTTEKKGRLLVRTIESVGRDEYAEPSQDGVEFAEHLRGVLELPPEAPDDERDIDDGNDDGEQDIAELDTEQSDKRQQQ